jgi:hypothetical protein
MAGFTQFSDQHLHPDAEGLKEGHLRFPATP